MTVKRQTETQMPTTEAGVNPIEQLAAMVNMSVAKASAGRDLTEDAFNFFLSLASKYGLNPLGKGEIYAYDGVTMDDAKKIMRGKPIY